MIIALKSFFNDFFSHPTEAKEHLYSVNVGNHILFVLIAKAVRISGLCIFISSFF